jgi:hypothetical protein
MVEVCTGFWLENPRERGHLEHPIVDERIILNGSSKSGTGAWTELVWIRTGVVGGLL